MFNINISYNSIKLRNRYTISLIHDRQFNNKPHIDDKSVKIKVLTKARHVQILHNGSNESMKNNLRLIIERIVEISQGKKIDLHTNSLPLFKAIAYHSNGWMPSGKIWIKRDESVVDDKWYPLLNLKIKGKLSVSWISKDKINEPITNVSVKNIDLAEAVKQDYIHNDIEKTVLILSEGRSENNSHLHTLVKKDAMNFYYADKTYFNHFYCINQKVLDNLTLADLDDVNVKKGKVLIAIFDGDYLDKWVDENINFVTFVRYHISYWYKTIIFNLYGDEGIKPKFNTHTDIENVNKYQSIITSEEMKSRISALTGQIDRTISTNMDNIVKGANDNLTWYGNPNSDGVLDIKLPVKLVDEVLDDYIWRNNGSVSSEDGINKYLNLHDSSNKWEDSVIIVNKNNEILVAFITCKDLPIISHVASRYDEIVDLLDNVHYPKRRTFYNRQRTGESLFSDGYLGKNWVLGEKFGSIFVTKPMIALKNPEQYFDNIDLIVHCWYSIWGIEKIISPSLGNYREFQMQFCNYNLFNGANFPVTHIGASYKFNSALHQDSGLVGINEVILYKGSKNQYFYNYRANSSFHISKDSLILQPNHIPHGTVPIEHEGVGLVNMTKGSSTVVNRH